MGTKEKTAEATIDSKASWIAAIAAKTGLGENTVCKTLSKYQIEADPSAASPRRLTVTRISFEGTKSGNDEGPFNFEWDDLRPGLNGLVTDRNLRGKTTVLHILRWLLRGRRPENFQEDVYRWISKASIEFSIDNTLLRVQTDMTADGKSSLHEWRPKRGHRKKDKWTKIGTVTDLEHLEDLLSQQFLHRLQMDSLSTFMKNAGKDGEIITHSWNALSSVLFIGTGDPAYRSLLGEIPPESGVNSRLLSVFLGLPWIAAYSRSHAAASLVKYTIDRSTQPEDGSDRSIRLKALQDRLVELNAERAAADFSELIEDQRTLRADYVARQQDLRKALRNQSNAQTRLREAEAMASADQRELRDFDEAAEAEAIFGSLDPSCCPRCDKSIEDQRKKREREYHQCSVCGRNAVTRTELESERRDLKSRAVASRKAKAVAKRAMGEADKAAAEVSSQLKALEEKATEIERSINASKSDVETRIEIAQIEGQIVGLEADSSGESSDATELEVLQAATKLIKPLYEERQKKLLRVVSKKLVEYARSFGISQLESAVLLGNANLKLKKGGSSTSFSKVTPGEKLRLKVATALALIKVGEDEGYGRFPGLLVIDSPGDNETSLEDVDALMTGLLKVVEELDWLQIVVASRTSAAVESALRECNVKRASGDDYLW